jgi:hypothetical protein
MIFEELLTTTNSLADLKQKTDLKNNKSIQENTDARYRVLLTQTASFISTIDYLYSDIRIEKNTDIISAAKELLDSLEKVVKSGLASQEEVSKAENAYKTLQVNMKKEWGRQYISFTGPTLSTLDAIKGIDSDSVSDCIQKISIAEDWEVGVNRFQTMVKGIEEAGQLIQKLGLDDEIILFLQNTNAGKATLKDLNDKVLAWIRDEKLENKIRISFVRK